MADDQNQQSTMNLQQQQQQELIENKFETSTNDEAEAINSFVEIVNNVIRNNGNHNPMSEKTALKFLRARKFDVRRAIELYKAHEETRASEGLASIDIDDDRFKAELLSEKFTILKCRDPNNCMIALFKAKLHQPDRSSTRNSQSIEEIHRYTLQGIVYQLDAALDDDVTQRNGIVLIYDMRESDLNTNFDLDLCKKILNLLKGAYPAKLKRVLVVNSPFWFKFVFKFLRVIARQKLQERVELVSVNQLHKYLPPESLTPDFGGTHEHDHQAWLKECEELHRNRTNDLCDPRFAQSLLRNTNNSNSPIQNDSSNNSSSNTVSSNEIINHMMSGTLVTSITGQTSRSPTKNFDTNYSIATSTSSSISQINQNKNPQSIRPTINLKDIVSQYANDSMLMRSQQLNASSIQQQQLAAMNLINKPDFYDYDDSGLTLPQFIDLIKTKGFSGLGYEYECEIVENGKTGTFLASTENMAKDRYVNIKCFDHSRVILEPYDLVEPEQDEQVGCGDLPTSTTGSSTDYINANWVDGYRQPKAYISTQGPIATTLNDFWRMIWQTSCRVIAMVTPNMEKNVSKCDKYWPCPEQRLILAGVYVIEYIGIESSEDFTITQLKLTNTRSQVSRDIWHMQFTSWPDFGIPQTGKALLQYRQKVLNKQEEAIKTCGLGSGSSATYPPIVVHCSAGVGRSGTFITIDICINKLDATNLVDVKNVVEKLREQRYLSVQTRDQYIFCYKSVFEYAMSKNLLQGQELGNLFNYNQLSDLDM